MSLTFWFQCTFLSSPDSWVEALFFLSTQDHVFSMRATMAECAFQGAMDFIASACLVLLEQDAKVIYDAIKNIRWVKSFYALR